MQPISDAAFPRFQYFRISANMQQQQQQQPQQSYMTTSPLPQLIPSGAPTTSVLVPVEQGASFATPAPPDTPKHKGGGPHTQHTPAGKPYTPTHAVQRGKSVPRGGQEGGSKSESVEMSSDVSDSGCASCGEGGQGGDDDVDAQMELASNEDSCSTQGEEGAGSERGAKGKGKRKYYMYGPHKLIKPIKDIPPRFQMMLAENSAAKARCEGQPIYMQLTPADLLALEQGDNGSGLNADAQCFYPTQQFDTVMLDESGLATFTNTTVVSANLPPPIMMPPPPVIQAAGGQPPVNVVYSCIPSSSSSSSASLPPPPAYSRPLPAASAAPVRSGDGKVLPVASSVNQGKGQANSGLDKRPDEFARPSSCGKAIDVASSAATRVSVSSLSVNAPPQPFPASSSMPPPLPAPPLHAGPAPNPAPPVAGGGKQCFYVYPSHSTGFPTVPATPPQGQSHAPGLSQGQVVYVMNPQGYGPAPPCTAYQPSMMAPPAHAMGMPCPPVAVQ